MKNFWSVDLYFWADSNSDSCSLYRSPDWNITQHDKYMNHIHATEHDKQLLLGSTRKRDESLMVCWGASQLRLIQEEYLRQGVKASVWSSMVVACKMLVFLSSPLPYPRCQLWLVSHTVGRVWGTCWEMLSCNYSWRWVAGSRMRATLLCWFGILYLFGQRILMSGCMTARRCAKVLAGGSKYPWPACCEGRPDTAILLPAWLNILRNLWFIFCWWTHYII